MVAETVIGPRPEIVVVVVVFPVAWKAVRSELSVSVTSVADAHVTGPLPPWQLR